MAEESEGGGDEGAEEEDGEEVGGARLRGELKQIVDQHRACDEVGLADLLRESESGCKFPAYEISRETSRPLSPAKMLMLFVQKTESSPMYTL